MASGKSFLFANTSNGIPAKAGLPNNECNSVFADSNFSASAASTTKLHD